VVATGGIALGGYDTYGTGRIEIELYDPLNPALTAILNGNQMRAISLAHAQRAKAIYVDLVAKSTEARKDPQPHLADSVNTYTIKTFTTYGPRWTGVMEVINPHIIPHERGWTDPRTGEYHAGAHDLNHVLEALAF
jgi:hypothetical protein